MLCFNRVKEAVYDSEKLNRKKCQKKVKLQHLTIFTPQILQGQRTNAIDHSQPAATSLSSNVSQIDQQ